MSIRINQSDKKSDRAFTVEQTDNDPIRPRRYFERTVVALPNGTALAVDVYADSVQVSSYREHTDGRTYGAGLALTPTGSSGVTITTEDWK